jgi:MFS family permease
MSILASILASTIKAMNAGGGQKRAASGSDTDSRKRLAHFLLCLASFMAVVDTTIISIALPSMRWEMGFSGADVQWILNGYTLAFGGLLLLLGRAGDLWGRRRVFMAGHALFGVASLVGGLRWRLLTCASSAVMALPVVLLGLPKNRSPGEQEGDGGG